MTDTTPRHQPRQDADRRSVVLVYILFLIGLCTGGLVSIAGAIIAHTKSNEVARVYQSHLDYQIRTFWMGLVIGIVGSLLLVVLIGIPILLGLFIWTLVRCIKGLMAANDGQPIDNPQTMLW
ncbi:MULTISPECIES: DUF4870 family protein [Kordiimonas]|uniref:Uncharacterized membrane protein n=1 Tax=Kordiimonas lacus TaxID=637679 RepID=A0A1G7EHG1_9PROT|nr:MULTISPECIES: DUF4870 domain-containing protein [Kordiimonas]SDE62875.1 Uncharacterized membrane protein [Kordiimonas lacus]